MKTVSPGWWYKRRPVFLQAQGENGKWPTARLHYWEAPSVSTKLSDSGLHAHAGCSVVAQTIHKMYSFNKEFCISAVVMQIKSHFFCSGCVYLNTYSCVILSLPCIVPTFAFVWTAHTHTHTQETYPERRSPTWGHQRTKHHSEWCKSCQKWPRAPSTLAAVEPEWVSG